MIRKILLVMVGVLLLIYPEIGAAQYPDEAAILDLAWSPNGEWLAIGYQNGTVEVREGASQQVIFTFENGHTPAASVAWHPIDPKVLAVAIDTEIYLLDISANQILATLMGTPFSTDVSLESQGFTEQMRKVVWNSDGTKLASLSDAGIFRVWDLQSNQQILLVDEYFYQSGSIAWGANGTELAISVVFKVKIFELGNNTIRDLKQGEFQANWMGTLDWSPDGTKIAIGSVFAEAHTFSANTGDRLQTVVIDPVLQIAVRDVMWHPGNRYYAGATSSGVIYVWDSTTGQEVVHYDNDAVPMRAVAWSPDGSQLAYGGDDGVLHIVPFSAGE